MTIPIRMYTKIIMSEHKSCDSCGRDEASLPEPATGSEKLVMDADHLWICRRAEVG